MIHREVEIAMAGMIFATSAICILSIGEWAAFNHAGMATKTIAVIKITCATIAVIAGCVDATASDFSILCCVVRQTH
jgi:hypothetical protein